MDCGNVENLCRHEEDMEAKHDRVELEQECDSPKVVANVNVAQSSLSLGNKVKIDEAPKVGMEFESEDDAYVFYNRYARVVGFSVRKDFLNKSKVNGAVVSRRFTCFKEGHRRKDKRDAYVKKPRMQTRTGCLAQMTISRQPNGKYHVIHFEAKHNHEEVSPNLVHMLPSQRRIAFAQTVEADLRLQEELKLASASRYKDLCRPAVKVSARAAESEESFLFALEKFDEVMQEVEQILNVNPPEESQVVADSPESDHVSNTQKEGIVRDTRRVMQGLHGFETNPLIGYMYQQPPNLDMFQQQEMDCEDQHL